MDRKPRVGQGVRFLLVVAVAAALASTASRVPEALARVEAFRVRAVLLEGQTFLDLETALATVGIPGDASVWDDFAEWEARLETHPLVKDASLQRRLPDTLVIRVVERTPVALVPTPTLEPVDAEGHLLPLDPAAQALDLPLLRVRAPADSVAPSRLRIRTLASEVARLGGAEPRFMSRVAELGWDENGDAVALWGDPVVQIRFRPPLGLRRVREALHVLSDASARFPERTLQSVDLRYDDQVVVRFQ